MASCNLALQGALTVNGQGCGCAPGQIPSTKTFGLAFACPQKFFEGIVSTDCPKQITSPNGWVPLPVVDSLKDVQLLALRTNAPMQLRYGGVAATHNGTGGTFPVTFSGGEEYRWQEIRREPDGSTTTRYDATATFSASTLSAAQIADVLNAAAVTAGAGVMPVTVGADGQLVITATTQDARVALQNVTPLASIGFAVGNAESSDGEDPNVVPVFGQVLLELGTPGLTGIEIQGTGQVEILAAGAAA